MLRRRGLENGKWTFKNVRPNSSSLTKIIIMIERVLTSLDLVLLSSHIYISKMNIRWNNQNYHHLNQSKCISSFLFHTSRRDSKTPVTLLSECMDYKYTCHVIIDQPQTKVNLRLMWITIIVFKNWSSRSTQLFSRNLKCWYRLLH